MFDQAIVKLTNVSKHYTRGSEKVQVLHHVDLEIGRGDFVALIGPSGSGKTTLLNLIAGLDQPSMGRVVVGGVDITQMSETNLARWRTNRMVSEAETLGVFRKKRLARPVLYARDLSHSASPSEKVAKLLRNMNASRIAERQAGEECDVSHGKGVTSQEV